MINLPSQSELDLGYFGYFLLLKGLYVTFRNCLLTMIPVAVMSTAVSVLLLSEPASAKTVR